MNKNLVTFIVFIVLLVFFINGFSNSYTYHNISNLAYVLALAIDVGEKAEMKITAQFTKDSSFSTGSDSSSGESNKPILVSCQADSLFSGLNLINTYIGKEVNLSHCSVVVFSEDFAKKGIASQIYSLTNNQEISPSANIVVSKCSAYDYLNNVRPNIEKISVEYYDTFSITNKFTGYFSNISIGDFYNALSCDVCYPTAILGGLDLSAKEKLSKNSENSKESSSSDSSSNSSEESSSQSSSNENPQENLSDNVITNTEDLIAGSSSVEDTRGTENIGIAIFDNEKLRGELTAIETVCHLLIQNEIDTCIISIDNPLDSEKKTELSLYPKKKSKVSVKIEDDIPKISVEINLDADILTIEDDVNYSSEEVLTIYSEATEDYLEEHFKEYFNKISKEYSTDIDGFSHDALSNFLTDAEWKAFKWNEKFKCSEFDISVNLDTISTLLVKKT